MARLPALQLQAISGGWRVSVKQVVYERSRSLTWPKVFAGIPVSTLWLGSGSVSKNGCVYQELHSATGLEFGFSP
jgi:hypothetical protein